MRSRVLGSALLFAAMLPLMATGRPSAQETRPKEPHRVLGNLPFSYSYPEILNLARQNGKPIFAYFTYGT